MPWKIGPPDEQLIMTSVKLTREEREWLMAQPGGNLSRTVRRLIKEARWEEEGREPKTYKDEE